MKKIRQKLVTPLFLFVQIAISLILVGWHANVSAVDLNGRTITMVGKENIKIKRCCKDRDTFSMTITFGVDVWTAVDDEGDTYSGTYTSDSKGKKFSIQWDNASKNNFNDELEEWATELADENVTITSAIYSFQLKVNKKLKAKVKGKIKLNGFASSSGSGSGSYKLTAKGIF